VSVDFDALRAEFRAAKAIASQHARWGPDDPSLPSNTCRYCGRRWQRWAGTQFDGHAACTVPYEFKQRLRELLQSPSVTYEAVAKAIGVADPVVRSWTFPIMCRS
jgi:hypothetical protein